jgi:hypothetical protein
MHPIDSMRSAGSWIALAIVVAGCRAVPAVPPVDGADAEEDPGDDPEDPGDALPVVAAAGAAPASLREALVAEAHRELAAVAESHYAHRTHVDEAAGVFDYDCSGFVGYALARAAPVALQAVVEASRPRPLAKHFAAFFALPVAPWRRVARAKDLVAGDVIAWLEPPAKHSRNTGHVMIVDGAPRAGGRSGELVVAVIDSSHSGHGAGDARNRGHASGLGTGALVLLTGRDGEPVGYRWSASRHSVAYRTEVALGHLP